MKKSTLIIMLLAMASGGPAHAADAPGEAGDAAKTEQVQRRRDPTVGIPPPAPGAAMPVQPGAINPANGQYYPPTGNGDVINPVTGERYIGTPGGYLNPNTGEFMPKIR